MQDEHIKNCVDADLKKIRQSPSILEELAIELPIEEIETIFARHGVIQLRAISASDKLLLGCGNTPATASDLHLAKKHTHDNYDTINPQLSMNPSIIGAFGEDKGLLSLLPSNHYNILAIEAVTIAKHAGEFNYDYLGCMRENFQTMEILLNQVEEVFPSFEASNLFWELPPEIGVGAGSNEALGRNETEGKGLVKKNEEEEGWVQAVKKDKDTGQSQGY